MRNVTIVMNLTVYIVLRLAFSLLLKIHYFSVDPFNMYIDDIATATKPHLDTKHVQIGTKASCQEGNSRLFIAQCNMAEMRVDQLRSTIIGDMLARMLEFSIVDVLRRNHVSDLGSQIY
ncbi:arginine--tRNA ligase, chloroplastic/mitochondrial-like protein isoform X2 [Tanacetum coccineum]|uniref:Arginine--tRNA ligase, chloroplastic/mitochondrial-like protein isoform X2 n=1 Tax=Tanacetum coccineum TaxID=301880 RepID=A0ABQ5BSB7_9ASTR